MVNVMRNALHVEFIRDVRDLIKRIGAGGLGITELFTKLEQLIETELVLFEVIVKSVLTRQLEELDKLRDEVLRGFTLAVEALLHIPVAAKREAAEKIMLILAHYGNIAKKSYDEQSALFYDLVRELELAANKALVTAAGLSEWVEQLKSANQLFVDTMHARDIEAEQRPAAGLKEARA
jgi:hypothetical protein